MISTEVAGNSRRSGNWERPSPLRHSQEATPRELSDKKSLEAAPAQPDLEVIDARDLHRLGEGGVGLQQRGSPRPRPALPGRLEVLGPVAALPLANLAVAFRAEHASESREDQSLTSCEDP